MQKHRFGSNPYQQALRGCNDMDGGAIHVAATIMSYPYHNHSNLLNNCCHNGWHPFTYMTPLSVLPFIVALCRFGQDTYRHVLSGYNNKDTRAMVLYPCRDYTEWTLNALISRSTQYDTQLFLVVTACFTLLPLAGHWASCPTSQLPPAIFSSSIIIMPCCCWRH